MRGCSDLATLARDRGVIPVARIALDTLVEKLFSCKIDKNPSIRLSDWDQQLSKEQRSYAALDAYAHMFAYLKIMTIAYVDPSKVPALLRSALKASDHVLLFTTNKQAAVASGTVLGPAEHVTLFGPLSSNTLMRIQLEQGNVQHLAAIVREDAEKNH